MFIKNTVNSDVLTLAVWTLIVTAPIHCKAAIGEQVMEH